jgi:Transposase and inactivated derivatives
MHPEQRNEEQSTKEVISGNQTSLRAMEFSYQGRITEAGEIFNEIMKNPGKMFEMFRIDIKRACENAIERVIAMELTAYLGREKYERSRGKHKNYRNGSYSRSFTAKGIGTLNLDVPRDRDGQFHSKVIKRYERYEEEIAHDVQAMFLSGMSTRGIELLSQHLLGRRISSGEVSKINGELVTAVERWRTRSLADTDVEYMIMDGVFFKIRVKEHVPAEDGADEEVVKDEVKRIPMLVVIGVTKTKQRLFLAIQQGDKDSATTWREIFKDLKQRGLKASEVKLGIMDGLQGLESVFCEEFQNARVQRCIVHVMRNVITKAPRTSRQEVTDSLRDIFYAEDRKTAMVRVDDFVKKYDGVIPSAVASLKRAIKPCLTFFDFPKEEWTALRTTNAIERVNKEFKRRTKPMEILASEKSAYLILSFVAYKMEQNWKSAPFGKSNLPTLKNFTQLT